jgi:aminopeptidase N
MPYDPTSQSNLDEAKTNHIHLDLTVDFDAKILSGSAELEIEAIADAVHKVVLDTSFIDIRAVSVAGQALSVNIWI